MGSHPENTDRRGDDAIRRFWNTRLADPSACELPLDHPRAGIQSFVRDEVYYRLPPEVTVPSDTNSEDPLLTLLAGGVTAVLAKYSGQTDVTIGTLSTRFDEQAGERRVGLLPLRSRLSDEMRFPELLETITDTIMEASSYQGGTLDALMQEAAGSGPSGTPFFHILLVTQGRNGNGEITDEDIDSLWEQVQSCDAVVYAAERDGAIELRCDYDIDVLEVHTIERFLGHVSQALSGLLANDDLTLSELSILTDGEREQILQVWNSTEVHYPNVDCLHSLFEAQAAATPDADALLWKTRCSPIASSTDVPTSWRTGCAAWAWGPMCPWACSWSAPWRWLLPCTGF